MKFLKRIRIFVIYSLVLSILYIPNTGYAAWSGSAYSPGETLNPECAPTDSGCTVNIGYTLSSGNIGIGSTTPWGKLSVNPNGITGPSFVIGSSTGTSFVVDNGGRVGVGTSSPGKKLQVYVTTSGDGIGIDGTTNPAFNLRINGVTKGNVAAETTGNAWFTGAALNDIALIASSGNLALVTGTTARLYVSTAGNVGIGTTSPYGKLAVTNTGTDPSFVVEDSTSPDTTPFIIDANGNVGVGISAPTAKLHVYPNVNSINGLIVRGDNNQSADIQQWQNSSGTTLASILAGGVFYTAADGTGFIADAGGSYRVGFMKYGGFYGSFVHNSVSPFTIYSNSNSDIRTVGTMRTDLIIDASGLVGIGTSTPYAKLAITNTGTNPSFVVEDSTSPDSTPFMIDASGNVGVGTSSPDSKLHVFTVGQNPVTFETGGSTTGIEAGQMILRSYRGGYGSGITFQSKETGTNTFLSQATIEAEGSGNWSSVAAASSYLRFSTISAGTLAENMRITSTGNVGIGNTTPEGKLQILKTGTFSTTDSTSASQVFENGDGLTVGYTGGISWIVRNATVTQGAFISAYNENGSGSTGLALGTKASSGVLSERLTITSGGNIGIGTTTPFATFAINPTAGNASNQFVVGSSTATSFLINNSGNIGIATTSPSSLISIKQNANTSSNGIWQSGTDGDFRSIYMSDTSGTLSFFGGDTAGALNTATLSSAGTWTNASDRSYKENIANLDTKYNLNTLLSIQPRFYTMKGSGKPQIGFIAQELQPILPEVVEGTEGSLGISYGNMVALLVQAIKDINTKVDNLATTVSDKVKVIFGEKVETKRLCLEGLCITRDELQRILYTTNVNGIYEQTIPSSTNNQQNNSNNSSNNSTNQNASNNNVGTSTEQTNNSTTTPQSNINPDAGSNNTNNTETNTQTNTQSDNTQGSTTPATIPETPPETTIEQPVPPQTPDISSTTLNTLPEQTN